MTGAYMLPAGYVAQPPAMYRPVEGGPTWQPDVYPYAARLAGERRASCLIDLGCSKADKLLALAGDGWQTIGVDLPENLSVARMAAADDYPMCTWVSFDFDAPLAGAVIPQRLEYAAPGAFVICSDVIEHLVYPERLVAVIRRLLASGGGGAVISTPDRDRVYGRGHLGPPGNLCHVREWAADELVAWLESEGLHVTSVAHQRSNDQPGSPEATVVVTIDP